MPRVYKRRVDARAYSNYTADTLNKAIEAVANGQSLRSAEKEFKIPRATLQRKINGRYSAC